MKILLRLIVLALLALPSVASAQSTATPVLPGYITTTGCPSTNLTPCFIQYGSTVPISGSVSLSPTPSVSLSPLAIAPVVSGALSGEVLKGGSGNLFSAYLTAGATPLWLMVMNSASLSGSNGPTTAGTAAGNLQDCIGPYTNSTASINYAPGPAEAFSTGITLYASSTACGTLTLSSTATMLHGSVQ